MWAGCSRGELSCFENCAVEREARREEERAGVSGWSSRRTERRAGHTSRAGCPGRRSRGAQRMVQVEDLANCSGRRRREAGEEGGERATERGWAAGAGGRRAVGRVAERKRRLSGKVSCKAESGERRADAKRRTAPPWADAERGGRRRRRGGATRTGREGMGRLCARSCSVGGHRGRKSGQERGGEDEGRRREGQGRAGLVRPLS